MAGKKTHKEMKSGGISTDAKKTLLSLFDEGEFTETRQFVSRDGDCGGVITGFGYAEGVPLYAFAQENNEKSGGMNKIAAEKIKDIYAMAAKNGSPIVAIYNSKGGNVNEGGDLLAAYSNIISKSAQLSGVVPQISIVNGICAGINATLCSMADFVLMTKDSELFLTPPFLAKDGKTEGAGTAKNAAKSGTASIVLSDTGNAVEMAKKLLRLLPQNNLEISCNEVYIENTAPISAGLKGMDLINALADVDSIVEINQEFGAGAVTALGSLKSRTVGFVLTSNADGRLSADDSAKIARFVTICDSYSIPIVTLLDTEGFESTSKGELLGSIRNSAKLAQAYNSSTTQKITVITGNAIGASAIAIGCFAGGSDLCLAFPDAVISPVTPRAAAVLLGEKNLDAAEAKYKENDASVYAAQAKGIIDRVIEPEELRREIISSLDITESKRELFPSKKHINFVF